jgi:tRNA pseudouridine55 synthase
LKARAQRSPLCGVLNLNKASGPTSRDIVNRVARLLGKVKVGHAGTLDPLASGVLVVCVGAATRLIEYVQRMPKTYRTVIRLGAQSNTLDLDGVIVESPNAIAPSEADVRTAVATQIGRIRQTPPQFSALKVGGRRAYELARAGSEADLLPRDVEIHRIDMLSYTWPRLELDIDCGGGTYIRSIARDVGGRLGSGGLVEVLTRTRIGSFQISDAVDPEAMTRDSIEEFMRPALEAVGSMPQVTLTAEQISDILHGRSLDLASVRDVPTLASEVALVGSDGRLTAVAELDASAGRIQPRRVLSE